MLAHLILGDMANTADASEVRMKPHMVFVGAMDHYDAEFVQKDAEKVLETLNDPFSYPNKDSRPYELFKIEKRELPAPRTRTAIGSGNLLTFVDV